jgi:hypothetical protein
VIVHDAPAFGQAFENQREASMRSVLCAFQASATEYNSGVRRQQSDLKL